MGLISLTVSLNGFVFFEHSDFVSTAIASNNSVQVGQSSDTGVAPIPGTTGGGTTYGSKDSQAPRVSNLTVNVSFDTATISWSTDELSLSRTSWGSTSEVSSGTLVGEKFNKTHSALITGLASSTRYYFSLTNIDPFGNSGIYSGEFSTLGRPDDVAPANPSRFSAVPRGEIIQLSWVNTSELDLAAVRIVRSDKFFPLDPLNGEVIFEGLGNSFIDTNVEPGVVYYYSIFSRDRSGNYSSGAITYTMLAGTEDGFSIDPQTGAPVIDLQLPFSPDYSPTPKTFQDFLLSYKDGNTLDSFNAVVPVGEGLKIVVPKDKLNEAGSFLTLTIKDSGLQTSESSYLFSYDESNKQFSLVTPEFDTPNGYDLIVTVFTSSKLIIEKVNGKVQVVKTAQAADEANGQASRAMTRYIVLGVLGASAVIVTVHFVRMARIRARLDATDSANQDTKV